MIKFFEFLSVRSPPFLTKGTRRIFNLILLPDTLHSRAGRELQLFLAGGFKIIDWIVEQGLEVMVDLKFFDVPQTVASAVGQLKSHGISFTTVHGNDAILKAAAEAKHDVKILAVTVLTSLDQADLKDLGFQCPVEDLVFSRACVLWT